MSEFVQLHILVSYPPSNLNRDDLGRPKTAVVGGKQRLRISSQSLKRAWRTSELFTSHVEGHIGIRTRSLGEHIQRALEQGISLSDLLNRRDSPQVRTPLSHDDAELWAKKIIESVKKSKKEKTSGKAKDPKKETKDDESKSEPLTHFSPEDINRIDGILQKITSGDKKIDDKDLFFFSDIQSAVDISMFGRMLASQPQYSVEAAVQVAHAFTVNQVVVEDDYFTAVDDLNEGIEDMGAGHLGEVEFGSGVFYTYICINKSLLMKNLNGDSALVQAALTGFVQASLKVPPSGKQNSFASRAYASYVLAEKGTQQPRSLAVAFLEPVKGTDEDGNILSIAVNRITKTRDNFEKVYGPCALKMFELNVLNGSGSIEELQSFVADSHE